MLLFSRARLFPRMQMFIRARAAHRKKQWTEVQQWCARVIDIADDWNAIEQAHLRLALAEQKRAGFDGGRRAFQVITLPHKQRKGPSSKERTACGVSVWCWTAILHCCFCGLRRNGGTKASENVQATAASTTLELFSGSRVLLRDRSTVGAKENHTHQSHPRDLQARASKNHQTHHTRPRLLSLQHNQTYPCLAPLSSPHHAAKRPLVKTNSMG